VSPGDASACCGTLASRRGQAKALYQALLGAEPYVDEPYYVGFRLGDQEFGLDPNGHRQGTPGPVTYYRVEVLAKSLLVDSGKSVIVIAHHQAVMTNADWIIDLGPGAGHDGGRIVFEGTPADLVAARSTLTGQHLAAYVGT
jgi:hypothetical protein